MNYKIKGLAGILLFVFFIACHNQEENLGNFKAAGSGEPIEVIAQNVTALRIEVFNNDTVKSDKPIKGFGYNIYKDDALYIHQPSIPAVAGNNGFSTEGKAQKAAEFVVYKIGHNIMPPSVTPGELDSLGLLN